MGKEVLDDFEEPNPNREYNFLLDSVAFNRLAEKRNWIDLAEKSLELGFRYYKTANQDYELSGRGAKTYDANCIPHVKISDSFKAKMQVFDEIMDRLKVKRLSSIASFMRNHWILDGTYRILDDKTLIGQTTNRIFQFNEKLRKKHPFAQHYDAMNAEAALYNHCVLVTDDTDLRELVNNDFPDRAISTEKLIDIITNLIDK